jgi:hypothetical protein
VAGSALAGAISDALGGLLLEARARGSGSAVLL